MARQNTIGSHKTTISTDNKVTSVTYHTTAVVKFTNDTIILNSGGWLTTTTKARMNQASNQFGLGFKVYQKDYEWFVLYYETPIPFKDGMVLQR